MKLFDDFGDVKVREETIPEKSYLEKVLEVEKEILEIYKEDGRFEDFSDHHFEAYQLLHKKTQEKLANIKITQKILQEYIDARENSEENTQALIRGMYSAALLEIISTKTPETHTFIDGKGKTFNYLFYHIHNVKNLTLTNIKGNNILEGAGGNGGSATHIILHHITGNDLLYNASINGSATHITLHNITGDNILSDVGSWNGSAKYITLTNIKGYNTLPNPGWNGSAEHILEEHQLNEKQKSILSQIQTIVETIHTLSLEEQTKVHKQIARLQEEIFEEEKT